jgi:3-oxoacyl-[acyl-carrier protein] reductase
MHFGLNGSNRSTASGKNKNNSKGTVMNIDLSGKRVIVTGASRGIGLAIARAFAAEGARVAICARSEEAVNAAGDQLAGQAQAVIARAVDVTDSEGVKAFVAEVAAAWGGVDVLVNNAGQGRGGNLETLTPELILEHANILQMGHFRFVQAVVPHMRQQRWGRIIEINALAGAVPTPDGIPSVINRASCIALSRSLGMSLPKDNILVNSLNMGWIDTGQWDRHYKEMGPGVTREEFDAMVLKVVPLGRYGKPEDVAGMALFLASEYASFISAASIDIAGGMGGQIAYFPTLKRDFAEMVKTRNEGL